MTIRNSNFCFLYNRCCLLWFCHVHSPSFRKKIQVFLHCQALHETTKRDWVIWWLDTETNRIFKYGSAGSIPALPSHSVPRRVGECSLEFQSRKQSTAHLRSHCISQSKPRTRVLCRVRWSYLAHGNPPFCTGIVHWLVGKWRCPSIWSILVLYLHVLDSLVGEWVIGWLIAWVLRQDFTVAQVCLKSQSSCLRLQSAATTDMSHKLCTLSVFFQQFIIMAT